MAIRIDEIATFDFDRKALVTRILDNRIDRDFVVSQVTTNNDIMVYYQCFYLLQDATEADPGLFYEYWHDFSKLLNHGNSYRRDIAITLLANLASVDSDRKFDGACDGYLGILFDDKFKTAVSCIVNLRKVLVARPDLIDRVFATLIDHRKRSKYPEKQQEYIHGEISRLFDHVARFLSAEQRIAAIAFIGDGISSKSPKTRKICKDILKVKNSAVAPPV